MFRQRRTPSGVAVHTDYPFRLSLYTQPPHSEITLDDFEQWAIDRMQVLDRLDGLSTRPKELEREMRPVLAKFLPLTGRKSGDAERRKDHYSHYILRLAFCRSPELRARFVKLETLLFRLRYETDDLEDRRAFVASLGMQWDKVEPQEVRQYMKQLSDAAGGIAGALDEEYYKVDFWTVPDLVARRHVFVHKGKAYVPESHQLSLLVTEYSHMLEKALDATARTLPRLDEDQRLMPVLEHLSSGFGLSTYSGDATKIDGHFTAESMSTLDKDHHLPMCQSHMHRELLRRHHAHYLAREQYSRFLKHIGMPIEEAVRLWRLLYQKQSELKSVEYQVRHQYGTVGSRIDYKPMTCQEIYQRNLAEDASHTSGCPFARLKQNDLDQLLAQQGITDAADLNDIHRQCDQKRYNLACGRVYELTHLDDKTVYTSSITSPNEYFERSWEFAKTHRS